MFLECSPLPVAQGFSYLQVTSLWFRSWGVHELSETPRGNMMISSPKQVHYVYISNTLIITQRENQAYLK